MKFERDVRNLTITLTFDDDEQVSPLAIATLIAKAELGKFWTATVICPVQYRYLDCFDEFYEEPSDGATVTLHKSTCIRARVNRSV